MTILSRLRQSGVNAEAGNRPYVTDDDYPTQMRKRTQKKVNDLSPQVQSELVRPYKQPSYEAHEYYQVPQPGIDPWPGPLPWEPVPDIGTVFRPIISPSGGTYVFNINITMLSITEGAEIYYTTNGTVPTKESLKYTGVIFLTGDVVIKAIAYKGDLKSPVRTETYAIGGWSTPQKIPGGFDSLIYDAARGSSAIYVVGYGSGIDLIEIPYSGIVSTSKPDGSGADEYPRIAIDSSGYIHIVFTRYSGSSVDYCLLLYCTNSSGSWVTTTVETCGELTDSFNGADITFDAAGKVHIVYIKNIAATSLSELKYATNATGSWVLEVIEDSSAAADDYIVYSSIENISGTNYIVSYYYDTVTPTGLLRHAYGSAGSWTLETIVSGLYCEGIEIINSNGKPTVSYYGYVPAPRGQDPDPATVGLYVAQKDGTWTNNIIYTKAYTEQLYKRKFFENSSNELITLWYFDYSHVISNVLGTWLKQTCSYNTCQDVTGEISPADMCYAVFRANYGVTGIFITKKKLE